MKKSVKIFLIVLGCLLVLCSIATLILFLFAHGITSNHSTNDLSKYEQYLDNGQGYVAAKENMPALEVCGAYLNGTLSRRSNDGIFPFVSNALFLNYDETEYKKQCVEIEERYDFKTEGNACFQDVEANLYGFSVRAVQLDQYRKDTGYCLFIGENEEKHCIFYAFFEDHELDCIDDLNQTMTEMFYFPKEYCR